MSEEIMNEVEEVEETTPSELDTLKARADMMGIKYHHNVGVDRLRKQIDNAISGVKEEPKPKTVVTTASKDQVLTEEEFKQLDANERKRTAGTLVRVNVTCMNPAKKGWEGEIISVGSAKLGTFKKFVQFNTVEGWHIPFIIYEAMKERKCSIFINTKDEKGRPVSRARLINEFNIEVLPPLTKKELAELARKQAMANGTGD